MVGLRKVEETIKAGCLVLLLDDGCCGGGASQRRCSGSGAWLFCTTNALQRLDVSLKYSVQLLPRTVMRALNFEVCYIAGHGRLDRAKG
jgi:hypothetical protein